MKKYSPETNREEEGDGIDIEEEPNDHQAGQVKAPNISEMKPVTREAYGGGMYAAEDTKESSSQSSKGKENHPRASATQSADGPEEQAPEPKHKPPPSTGDRDLDITGQSYIQ